MSGLVGVLNAEEQLGGTLNPVKGLSGNLLYIPGAPGVGIVSTIRTSGDGSPGTTDTYTITYTNDTTSTFTVYNGADGYTHPLTHPPSIIEQDASNRFVTDTEKATWDAKQNALTAGTDYLAPGINVSLTLPTTGYSGTGPYTIALTATGAVTTSTKRYILMPDWNSTAATRALEKKAWNLVDDYEISAADTLTLTLTAVPATAVSFSLKEVV